MRWLALHFPCLPLEVAATDGVESPEPRALVSVEGSGAGRVLMVNAPAALQGVRPGQSPAAARALAPSLRFLKRNPKGERRALDALAAWALQFSSQVSLAPPDALVMEVAGSYRMFGGEVAFRHKVRQSLGRLNHEVCLVSAPGAEGALLLARAGMQCRLPHWPALRDCLETVPLSFLPLDGEKILRLREAGLKACGDLLKLPRAQLGRRLGGDFLAWWARLLGEVPDPKKCFEPPAVFDSGLDLPMAVETVEGLAFPARRLLLLLEGFLRGRQVAVQRLAWTLVHESRNQDPRPNTRIVQDMQIPARDAGQLLSLLRERLTRLTLVAPVRRLSLRADQLLAWAGETNPLTKDGTEGPDLSFLDRMRARLGAGAVSGLCSVADHRPEYAMRTCSPGTLGRAANFPERPPWLLAEPRLLESRNGLPWWRGPLHLEGERERITAGWWVERPVKRDYFAARCPQGLRLWIFLDHGAEKQWFLHGFFG